MICDRIAKGRVSGNTQLGRDIKGLPIKRKRCKIEKMCGLIVPICVVAIIIQKACIEADVLPRIKYIELLFNLYLLL